MQLKKQTKANKRTKKFSLVRTKKAKRKPKKESLLIPQNKKKQPTKKYPRKQESTKETQRGRCKSE